MRLRPYKTEQKLGSFNIYASHTFQHKLLAYAEFEKKVQSIICNQTKRGREIDSLAHDPRDVTSVLQRHLAISKPKVAATAVWQRLLSPSCERTHNSQRSIMVDVLVMIHSV